MQTGDPADDDDTWLRAITRKSHIRGEPPVHHGEFKGYLGPPPELRDWKLEVSGRLLSKISATNSISGDANRRVNLQRNGFIAKGKTPPSDFSYVAIVHATAKAIRAIPDMRCDVIYEPNEDTAHANIVCFDQDETNILTVADAIRKTLKRLTPAEVVADSAFANKAC